jgi:hypothetical protein
MQVRTSQLSLKKSKRSSIRHAPTNQLRSPKSLRRPHFVGDFLCRRSCFNYSFQVSPLAKLQAFTFGRLRVVSLSVFVIVLCLGFVLGLGFCSGVEVQKICGKLSWIGYWGFHLGFRRKLIQVEALRLIQCQRQCFIQSF